MALASRPMPETADSVQLRRTNKAIRNVPFTSTPAGRLAHMAAIPWRTGNGSSQPNAIVRDANPRTNGRRPEFHVNSADVEVLEFNELVSPTDDPMQVIVIPPIRKSGAGCHSKAAAPPPSGARKHPSRGAWHKAERVCSRPEEPGAPEALDIETGDSGRPLC